MADTTRREYFRAYLRWYRRKYPEQRNRSRKKNYSQTRVPRTNRKWTIREITMLFEFNGTDRQLSKKINRSVQAIQQKRHLTKDKYLNPPFHSSKIRLMK